MLKSINLLYFEEIKTLQNVYCIYSELIVILYLITFAGNLNLNCITLG